MNFFKVASACPITNVADVNFNINEIKKCISNGLKQDCNLIVFPELSVTSYSCGDLFFQNKLLIESEKGIYALCEYSKEKNIIISVGAPILHNNCLFNCAVVIFDGKVIGIIPKSHLPNYSEFYEKRWFTSGLNIINETVNLSFQQDVPFGTNIIFSAGNAKIGFEVCEDLWVTIPPSSYLSLCGANIICNLSSSNELVGKADTRRNLVKNQSLRCIGSYIYSSSGVFESSTDVLFSGHLIISENGSTLAENKRFQRENEIITGIIDLDKLNNERLKNISFRDSMCLCPFIPKIIDINIKNTSINSFDRTIDKLPFVPKTESERELRCKEIFNIQTAALSKRFCHTKLKNAVIGISGGLDSTLALLVVVKTFDMLGLDRKNIKTITMPGFGTTDRTYINALKLCENLGTELKEINIVDACIQHFKDIGHDPAIHDVTYENVQARERTQILMDIANKNAGLLIGTGDLSELALGWCTYNGDHMSMYSVNCSIPKTLVRYLVEYVAEKELDGNASEVLMDILDTPVSPELLPKDSEGKIAQKTEDIVGPYELHDFFLFHFIKQGATPEKLLFLSENAFGDEYTKDEILKWRDMFLRRFFTQQFKRSCMPDGPKVGSISLSPRGDLRMPSDASYNSFM
ncbi:NAD(+) synthase [Clostridium senegalense]|uniref:Glutamine-dependent NAD(+) synthetase n=1 Tax=Clostridium senegalense TaxID=1465809 RepID=A0A6M0H3T9_9CLOT|nr:NAD(+) synthase [Clostridium senegalense]NEU05410.1 NAD(+) synthase [Clostridium senegalense]